MATPAGFWYHTRVQFDHTDAQGRVFYAHYFRLLDQARCAYWEALGFSEDDVRQIENDTVIVHVEADYLGPAAFYDLLRISVATARLGRSSLHLDYRVSMQVMTRRSSPPAWSWCRSISPQKPPGPGARLSGRL